MINVTDKACVKIKEIANSEKVEPRIRTGVVGGGCAGYSHNLFFESKEDVRATDQIFNINGIEVVIDMISITYLEGTTIDYIDGLLGSGFKFTNDKYKNTCGCGNSFSA